MQTQAFETRFSHSKRLFDDYKHTDATFDPPSNANRQAPAKRLRFLDEESRFLKPQKNARRLTFDDETELTRVSPLERRKIRKRTRFIDDEEENEPSLLKRQKTARKLSFDDEAELGAPVFPEVKKIHKRLRWDDEEEEGRPCLKKQVTASLSSRGESRLRSPNKFILPIEHMHAHKPKAAKQPQLEVPSHAAAVPPQSQSRKRLQYQPFTAPREPRKSGTVNVEKATPKVQLPSPRTDSFKTRIRRPWSAAEEELLIKMVRKYGCLWSLIVRLCMGTCLESRGQVPLKDKAMDIKFQYLKACRPLPKNFEYVSLRNRHKDELDAMGINF